MKIALRIPLGWAPPVQELTEWLVWLGRNSDVDIKFPVNRFGPSEARYQIVQEFLNTDCTHLWMIDSDCCPPQNLNLLKHDYPVVCGWYYQFSPSKDLKPFPCVFTEHPKIEHAVVSYKKNLWPNEPFRAAAAGTGCMLIRRDVLEKFDGANPFPYGHRKGKIVGEDICFCLMIGGVMIDPSYYCEHYHTWPMGEVYSRIKLAESCR